MVYQFVLVSQAPFESQRPWYGPSGTIFSNRDGLVGAAILRTCQRVYQEALPILYSKNVFGFCNPCHITKFKDVGLPCLGQSIPGVFSPDRILLVQVHSLSCLRSESCLFPINTFIVHDPVDLLADSIEALDGMSNLYGRLTLVRSIILHLDFINTRQEHISFDRMATWRHWAKVFFKHNEPKKLDDQDEHVGFPALDKLVLDFSCWNLKPNEKIIVRTASFDGSSIPFSHFRDCYLLNHLLPPQQPYYSQYSR